MVAQYSFSARNSVRPKDAVSSKREAYLYHLVENHPFADGNKRVGSMAALIFLDINNIDFDVPEELFAEMVLKVDGGKMLKSEIALFLKEYSRSR